MEAVKQGGGAPGVEMAGGEGVDDDGESDLDGLAVFKGGESDVPAGDKVAGAVWGGVPKAGVALVEAGVEVAVGSFVEGWGLALEAVGFDVAADRNFHEIVLFGGVSPWGTLLKVTWMQ